jgi:hypothetical protein
MGKAAREHLLRHFSGSSTANLIVEKLVAQIPHFAELRARRPIPTFGYSRTRFNSNTGSGGFTGTTYGGGATGNTGTTHAWANANTVEKHGRTLNKAKMTD